MKIESVDHNYLTTQIAFGVCSVDSNPDFWNILKETRKRGIVPNLTVNGVGINDLVARRLAGLCGAVAVSVNKANKEVAYDAIKRLSQDYQMNQINIHIVLAEDTVDFIFGVIKDIKTDSRLEKLNALVMLSFKDKRGTECYSPISLESASKLINYCLTNEVRHGFDSCFAHTYLKAIKDRPDFERLEQYVEPCESGLFSVYINTFGLVYACSFSEGIGCWKDGLNVLDFDTIEELWNSEKVQEWRKSLLGCDRVCPFYEIGS